MNTGPEVLIHPPDVGFLFLTRVSSDDGVTWDRDEDDLSGGLGPGGVQYGGERAWNGNFNLIGDDAEGSFYLEAGASEDASTMGQYRIVVTKTLVPYKFIFHDVVIDDSGAELSHGVTVWQMGVLGEHRDTGWIDWSPMGTGTRRQIRYLRWIVPWIPLIEPGL